MTSSIGQPDRPQSHQSGSRAWRTLFKVLFRTTPRPLIEFLRRRGRAPIEELVVVGRTSRRERRVLVSLLELDGHWYVGHPNGDAQWVRNLAAAGSAMVVEAGGRRTGVVANELAVGPERTAVIEEAGRMPFPAGQVYRRAGSHVEAVGRYFRLDVVAGDGDLA